MLFIIGTILSSFTQAIAYRYYQHSIETNRSICHHCRTRLRWHHIIPIFSYIILRGKCYTCQRKIPSYYPLMECLGGLLIYTAPFNTFQYTVILIILFICSQIDLEYQVVPNSWQLIYFIITLIVYHIPLYRLYFGALFFFIYGLIDHFFPNKIGGADIKLLLITYLIVGGLSILYITLYASLLALIYIGITKNYHTYIPFVPFLFLGTFLHSYFLIIHNSYTLIH